MNKSKILFNLIVCALLLECVFSLPPSKLLFQFTLMATTRESDGSEHDGDVSNKVDPDELKLLQICCSWSDKISDGVLQYSISDEVDDDNKQIVRNAIQDWDLSIDNLTFVDNKDPEKADVKIGFSDSDEDADGEEFHYGESLAAGLTKLTLNDKGFIDRVDVVFSGSIFDNKIDESELEQIVRHEIGHVLGLGHANFDDSIMFENIDSKTRNISDCEINGVIEANHWKLANSSDENNHGPERPDMRYIEC
jgi:predicted Zn-dependent protease